MLKSIKILTYLLQAVGCGCRFLRVGAPCRGERIAKLNRLMDIELELEQLGALKQHEPLTYPKIDLPPPPPQPVTPDEELANDTKKK